MSTSRAAITAAIFSPQSSPPKPEYLSHIRSRLLDEPLLKSLADAILDLPAIWETLVSARQPMADMADAPRLVKCFPAWIETGQSEILESDMSGVVTLPLLTIIHIVQYLEYLQQTGMTHSDFLDGVREGGIQGYCIGLLSAVIVACSEDEEDVVENAVAGIRLALGIGAFGDEGQMASTTESNTLAIRLRNPGDERDILQNFPDVSIRPESFKIADANLARSISRP